MRMTRVLLLAAMLTLARAGLASAGRAWQCSACLPKMFFNSSFYLECRKCGTPKGPYSKQELDGFCKRAERRAAAKAKADRLAAAKAKADRLAAAKAKGVAYRLAAAAERIAVSKPQRVSKEVRAAINAYEVRRDGRLAKAAAKQQRALRRQRLKAAVKDGFTLQ